MTREEILAMQPGRELDVLVAEKVMGLEIIWNKSGIDGKSYPQVTKKIGVDDLYAYSTNISAAWEVVEKLQENKVMDFKIRRLYCLAEMQYTARFWDNEGTYSADSLSAPEAICKAALLAVFRE